MDGEGGKKFSSSTKPWSVKDRTIFSKENNRMMWHMKSFGIR